MKSNKKWTHPGMQDVLPTWRWWWQNKANKEMSCEFTWDDAYQGGSSIKFKGSLKANDVNEIRLYKTKISLENGDKFQIVYKLKAAGSSNVKVGLAFAEDNNAFTYIQVGEASVGWNQKELDLSSYAGKTLSMISLRFESTTAVSGYEMYLGKLAVLGGSALTCGKVTNIKIDAKLGQVIGNLGLSWDRATGDVHHYNIYGSNELIGQTMSNAYYISKIKRVSGAETKMKIQIVPIKFDFTAGTKTVSESNWEALSKPVVKIKANKTIAKSGDNIQFVAQATNFPETFVWTLPKGVTLVSSSTKKDTVVCNFPNQGMFDVSLAVTNSIGTTTFKSKGLVMINNTQNLKNISFHKTILWSSGGNDNEKAKNLIDGNIKTKWCHGGKKEYYAVIDLQEAYRVFKFKLFDCNVNKDENAENVKNYRVLLSLDKQDWFEVVNEEGVGNINIKESNCNGTVARYVKLIPYDKDQKYYYKNLGI